MHNNARWAAVAARDSASDGAFVYCVKTTKIFCRPTCKARLARRSNVDFFDTAAEAEAAGYRSCKRCRPQLPTFTPGADKVKKACDILARSADSATVPSLESLAEEIGLTKHHFHRLFKRETGQTPHRYALSRRCRGMTRSTGSEESTPSPSFTSENNKAVIGRSGAAETNDLNASSPAGTRYGSSVIFYSVRTTMYGPLLVVFQDGHFRLVELGINGFDLMKPLEKSFPPSHYLHCRIEDVDTRYMVTFLGKIEGIVEALEKPSGKMLEVPTSITHESAEDDMMDMTWMREKVT